MFFVVKFGADEEQLFNPDCAVRVLMDDVRKRCHCVNRDTISLLDEKSKSIVKIPDETSMANAMNYFTDRASYILLTLEKRADATVYIPLLDDPGKDILGVLDSLTIGTKPGKGGHSRKASRTPQPVGKQSNSGRGRRK